MHEIQWMADPEEHDYPAARDYLELVMSPDDAAQCVSLLKAAPVSQKKSKDISRASGLELLDDSNAHVRKNLQKMREGKSLSPVLLVVDRASRKVIVADGFHRVSAVHFVDEDAEVPCKIAFWGQS
jgi:hypothetical protein